ncbi:unnamed protein product [Boreogadus saida]
MCYASSRYTVQHQPLVAAGRDSSSLNPPVGNSQSTFPTSVGDPQSAGASSSFTSSNSPATCLTTHYRTSACLTNSTLA